VQITVNITGAVTKKEFEKVLKQLGQAAPEVGGFRKKKGGALFCRSVERERSKDDVPRGRMIERSAQQPTHRAPHTHTPPVWRCTFTVLFHDRVAAAERLPALGGRPTPASERRESVCCTAMSCAVKAGGGAEMHTAGDHVPRQLSGRSSNGEPHHPSHCKRNSKPHDRIPA